MKIYLLLVICMATISSRLYSQSVGINTDGSPADGSALVDMKSSNKGLLIPRVNITSDVSSPAPGILVYQVTGTPGFYYNSGTSGSPAWRQLIAANTHLAVSNTTNAASELRLHEPSGSGANYTAFKAQAQAADYTFTLPNTPPGAVNQFLMVQAVASNNATLTWGNVSAAPGFVRVAKISSAGNTSYTATNNDELIGVDQTSGVAFGITLPSGASSGKTILIKLEKQHASSPTMTINPPAGGTIDGSASSISVTVAGGSRRYYGDGANAWYAW